MPKKSRAVGCTPMRPHRASDIARGGPAKAASFDSVSLAASNGVPVYSFNESSPQGVEPQPSAPAPIAPSPNDGPGSPAGYYALNCPRCNVTGAAGFWGASGILTRRQIWGL